MSRESPIEMARSGPFNYVSGYIDTEMWQHYFNSVCYRAVYFSKCIHFMPCQSGMYSFWHIK